MMEKPMLFSGPMVRAILEDRKTQTRRMVKPQPIPDRHFGGKGKLEWNPGKLHYTECNGAWNPIANAFEDFIANGHAPHPVGSLIWVKEAFQIGPCCELFVPLEMVEISTKEHGDCPFCGQTLGPWKPSIFMPRRLSRITLEVMAVRVEKVHDIGKDGRKAHDVLAEGITNAQIEDWRKWLHLDDAPAHAYGILWDEINGKGSWAKNPWVWVYTFRRVKP